MSLAHDIYAETNPAFCAWVLRTIANAYSSVQPEGPETPIVYLAAPMALSGDLAASFEGTNKKTGLLEWLERSPQVQVGLAQRVNGAMDIVTAGLRFGCFSQLLALDVDGRLRAGLRRPKPSATASLADDDIRTLKRAERLGHWFATAGTARSVFNVLGLTV